MRREPENRGGRRRGRGARSCSAAAVAVAVLLASAQASGALAVTGASDGGRSDAADLVAAADPDALKIVVDADGPVRVTGADLAAAGWDLTAVGAGDFSLESGGVAHAIEVRAADPTRFAAADSIVFHGRAMTGEFTRSNVYWLRRGAGLTVADVDGSPEPGAPVAAHFPATAQFEVDSVYVASMRAAEGPDRWMWGGPIRAPTAVTREVWLPEVAPGTGGVITITLQGYSADTAVSPDHHVIVSLEDRVVAEALFDGLGVHRTVGELPPGVLQTGANILSLEVPDDTGAALDAVFLNRVEVAYRGAYRAQAGRLDFGLPGPGRHTVRISGLASADIAVADVTNPAAARMVVGGATATEDDGSFSLGVTVEGAGGERYVVWERGTEAPPRAVDRNAPSDLVGGGDGADYLVVSHGALLASTLPLAEYRRSQGLRVQVVAVEDVYDEFSAGVYDPRAIGAFLAHAYGHWPGPPSTYVLLVGESNLDHRGAYGGGSTTIVPTMRIDTDLPGDVGAFASDVEFVTFDGDDPIPEMMIGRIPAETPAQVEAAVAKTLAFEAAAANSPWRARGVFVSDDDLPSEFEAFSDRLARRFGQDDVRHFRAASWPRDRNLTADIADAISEGALAVNYVGHGNVDMWGPWPGGGRIFQNADIERLRNTSAYPILATATCMNGWIDHPLRRRSMAEVWVTHPHGGVAAWAPSGYGFLAGEAALFDAFYEGLAGAQAVTLGELTVRAAASAYAEGGQWEDVSRMFILLGDPALVIRGGRPPGGPDRWRVQLPWLGS